MKTWSVFFFFISFDLVKMYFLVEKVYRFLCNQIKITGTTIIHHILVNIIDYDFKKCGYKGKENIFGLLSDVFYKYIYTKIKQEGFLIPQSEVRSCKPLKYLVSVALD